MPTSICVKKTKPTSVMKIREQGNENNFIKQYIQFYLSSKDTDFAVFITAPWGNGKTHFVKELVRSLEKDKPDLPRGVYVSLNGISSISEIDRALFTAIHPVLGSKYSRLAGHLLSGIFQAGINIAIPIGKKERQSIEFGLPNDLLNVVNTEGKNHKGWFLVFDDLERTSMPLTSLWGYFGDLVDSGQKVLLVGNEEELKAKYQDRQQSAASSSPENAEPTSPHLLSYQLVKEKVVGKTFYLHSEIHDIYGLLVDKDQYTTVYDTIIKNRDRVVAILDSFFAGKDETLHCNYRALKHCFRDYDYWMKQIKSKYRSKMKFCDDFFCEFIPLDYAVQIGNLVLERHQEEQGKSRAMACEILGRSSYLFGTDELDDRLFVLPWKILSKLLSNDSIDADALNLAVGRTSYFLQKETPSWIRLWHTSSLNDEEFKKQVNLLKTEIKEFKYIDPEEIIHVFCVFHGLREMGLLSKGDTAKEFSSYLEQVKSKINIDDMDSRKFDLSGLATGLAYFNEEHNHETVLKFKNKMKAVLNELRDNKRMVIVKQLIDNLDTDHRPFVEFFSMDNGFEPSPVLQNCDPSAFFQKFILLTPENMWSVFHVFENRYKSDKRERTDLLCSESKFVNAFFTEIEKWTNQHANDEESPKAYYMKLLARKSKEAYPFVHSMDGQSESAIVAEEVKKTPLT